MLQCALGVKLDISCVLPEPARVAEPRVSLELDTRCAALGCGGSDRALADAAMLLQALANPVPIVPHVFAAAAAKVPPGVLSGALPCVPIRSGRAAPKLVALGALAWRM